MATASEMPAIPTRMTTESQTRTTSALRHLLTRSWSQPRDVHFDQLCPCAGPRGQSINWKNHGKYVSCVATSLNVFVDLGLIDEGLRDLLVSAAAESDCGHK